MAAKKLLYYLTGAMRHFLADDAGAIADLEKARRTKYESKNETAEENKTAEIVLNERIATILTVSKAKRTSPDH